MVQNYLSGFLDLIASIIIFYQSITEVSQVNKYQLACL